MILQPPVTSVIEVSISFKYSGIMECSIKFDNIANIIMYAPSFRSVSDEVVIALSSILIILTEGLTVSVERL